jgi:putative ABC transport system permease protein
VEGAPADAGSRINRGWSATPDYFRTAGIPLRAGRAFAPEDRAGATPVALVNEEMARRLWPGQSPLGRRFRFGGPDAEAPRWITTVGVVGDALYGPFVRRPMAYFYVPYEQRPARRFSVLVRAQGDPAPLAPLLRARAREIDPDQPLDNVQTVERMYHDWTRGPRVMAAVMGGLGGFAVVLAALGLYGLVAYTVRQRAREIGIRIALGAGRRDVLELVARQAITLAAAGLAVGAMAAVALARFAAGVFSGMGGVDPLVLLLVGVLLSAVALLASVMPALAAARMEPLSVLRPD